MLYNFVNKKGITEQVEEERWFWEAFYRDGTKIKQFDEETGLFHQFSEIDQEKLIMFKMKSKHCKNSFLLPFDSKTMKLIHYYSNIVLHAATKNERQIRLYYFGYEKVVEGRTCRHLMFINFNDDLVIGE